jgi:hypothetical protein
MTIEVSKKSERVRDKIVIDAMQHFLTFLGNVSQQLLMRSVS